MRTLRETFPFSSGKFSKNGVIKMNINLVLMKIKHSNMDEGMKQSLSLILDKALGDGDIVARLEEEIQDFENKLKKSNLPLNNPLLLILKRIQDVAT